MSPHDFAYLAGLLKQRSGLILTADKEYLLESRLRPLIRSRGLTDFREFVNALRTGDRALIDDVVEAMTTNETSFFRDIKPFQLVRSFVLPALLAARADTRQLRIWCAACSTGQEPYSLAMVLDDERVRLEGWTWQIVATDIAPSVLAKARNGLYSQFEVQRGLPTPMLLKHFTKSGDSWQLKEEMRRKVMFRTVNLLDDLRGLGRFDLIFLRNVLIYFDPPTKSVILEKVSRQLATDGFLFLGGAETVIGVTQAFEPVPDQRGIYRPTGTTPTFAVASQPARPGLAGVRA
ncbi:MAG: protein-glutamate O-methyltransferase CheR [Rhodospirillales bacterium]|nr:MAG: protein-glutamate O-methyltransferase CheR [Rhodospirillales bacterium]